MKRMKHKHRVADARRVDHPKRASFVPDSNLFDARPIDGIGLKSSGCSPRCTLSSW
jgi:hypothetical protein